MMYRLGEVIYDITTCISLFPREVLSSVDSRDLYAHIFKWAQEFEELDCDYMSNIDAFAISKLQEYFSI